MGYSDNQGSYEVVRVGAAGCDRIQNTQSAEEYLRLKEIWQGNKERDTDHGIDHSVCVMEIQEMKSTGRRPEGPDR
jgi:hypothetical protein